PEDLAFLSVGELSALLRTRQVRAQELAELYLDRLRRLDEKLQCVVTLTPERALEQARRADRELAAGRWRGPLHGIPWGAKDLLAVRGYPTTWGAGPYRSQVLDEDATVVRRLDAAGAVLVAKLTLGELAMGDVWFGGTTKNPWKLEQGSSGSSAGSAAAVAAGLVGFAIGSETRGSILSPCTRCGATGLRPTFGAVPRTGAMALSWSMDKLGPIARTAQDCALIFDAIRGPDGADDTVVAAPFSWDPEADVRRLKVGYLASLFEREGGKDEDHEWRAHEREALEVLRRLGVELRPIELPDLPVDALSFILTAEAAAAFDELTRSGRDAELVRQDERAWPNIFRQARAIPAVEYIQANRVRRLAMQAMGRTLAGLDAYVSPTFGGANLPLTNLTGHPAVVLPVGFRADGTPTSITFCGNLFREDAALALAAAYQRATDHHRRRPPLG
ncbi:MAG: amidase, partial [Acidobacteriota bacterium]